MTLKRERKYGDILDRIDYYLKQSDDWSSVGDLDDLIVAASPQFFFKDVSARTISMFNVSGEITQDYFSLQMPETVTGWDSSQEAVDTGQPFTIERNKTVEQFDRLLDGLFPDGTETGSDTTEAGESFSEAIVRDNQYIDTSKDDIFPREGILLHDDNAGAIRIQRADPKDLSQGYNVYRNNASTEGNSYSKVAPWAENERTQLNDQPIHNYHNAYSTAKKSMVAGGMDAGKKPQVRLGLGASISRQQRRNLIQKVEKKLESREKAIKKGVRDRTRQRWKDNAEQFLIELPQNAQNAAGEGIRKLGEKALEAADRLKEYEDMFTEQAGAKIREGVEKAKPEIRKALQAVRREAENQFFNAQDTWESAKQFAREKAPIIQGVLQQAKVKGSPIWNAATKKGAALTDKAMYAAGVGLVKAQAATDSVSSFMGRMKSKFKEGYRAEMERQHGAMPEGDLYKNNPQAYWEKRGELATQYGRGNAEWDREKAIADRISDPEVANKAMDDAWAKWSATKAEVDVGAAKIGAKLANIENHVQKIKSGSGTVLPPSAGWPSAYGGASKVRSLQRNLKLAGLKPYQEAYTGTPEKPTARPVPEADPAAEAAPAEAGAPAEGQQLEFDPEAMAGGGQPQAEAAPEAAQDPKLMMEKLTALKARGEELGKDTAVVDQVMKIVQSELDRLNTLNTETPEVPAQPTAEQPYLPGMAPGAEPGADQQIPMPGMGAEPGAQPVAGGPGPQISGKEDGSGGAGAQVPASEREYAMSAPYGLPLYQGEPRGEGKVASFYDKRAAKAAKADAAKGDQSRQMGEAGGAATGGPMEVPGAVATGADRAARNVGPMELQETNEMTAPMDDYKQAAEEEEFKAKRSQSKSKIRTARANARVAKTRADEAEAKASRSEAESGAKIAHMLEKLDREIVELTAHSNPKVSSVLSRLEKAIDSKHKVPATKK